MAQAISLLQNNCTFLNNELKDTKLDDVDFCALTEITPFDLSRVIGVVNFTGLTGPISFAPGATARREANLAVYQINSNLSAVEVGVFIDGNLELNSSKLTFPNQLAPVSGTGNLKCLCIV